ncbi:MAG TPA: hypothetical protein VG456_25815 [Candidatus Sulfopaludibacter sp.]|jgi:hypothetical protein|nr:hypothetical protein [Candidatus Sulfopaludibacter sp.]
MIRRAYIIATLALGLVASAALSLPRCCGIVSSARTFQYYFHDLKQGAAPLSPVERFVYSLVLTHGVTPERHT